MGLRVENQGIRSSEKVSDYAMRIGANLIHESYKSKCIIHRQYSYEFVSTWQESTEWFAVHYQLDREVGAVVQ